MTDPAIDVGNFMAVLRKKCCSRATPTSKAWTVSSWLSTTRPTTPTVLAEREALRSISFLRMLTRHFERAPGVAQRGEDWPPLVLLRETRRSLASL
jgi:hypothetical protein